MDQAIEHVSRRGEVENARSIDHSFSFKASLA